MSEAASTTDQSAAAWRVKLGIGIFAFSILLPLGRIAVAASLGLPGTTMAGVTGAVLVIAEVLGILAVAVMGEPGFLHMQSRVFRFVKQYGPPREVSRIRYRVGLVMISGPILFVWLFPYFEAWLPGISAHPFPYVIGGDILIAAGLFVLGGDFWDKVRTLFVHSDKICSENE